MINSPYFFNDETYFFDQTSPLMERTISSFEQIQPNESEKMNTETNKENKICPIPKSQPTVDSKMKTFDSIKMLGQKTQRNENPSPKKEKENSEIDKKLGRIPNDSNKTGSHNKSSFDNIMRTIKPKISKYMHNLLNRSLKTTKYEFKRLDSVLNKELKKDFNLDLLNMTVKDIYLNFNISTKYSSHSIEDNLFDSSNENREIIQYIENNPEKEKDACEVLKLTYEEIIEKFIDDPKEGLENFKSIIRSEKYKLKKPVDLEKYISDIDYLFKNIRNWFEVKTGRQGKKRTKNL